MLSVVGLGKRHSGAARPLFSELRFAVGAGEIVALVGESGVGKSTLLNCIAGLEAADAGTILIGPDAIDMARLDEAAAAALRARRVGFVFQAFHVLPTLSVAQNIAVPLLLTRESMPPNTRGTSRNCSPASALPDSVRAGRHRFRAASCSGWRLRAPWCIDRP